MGAQKFTITQIGTVNDGRVAAAIDAKLKQAARDCTARPHDPAARKVTLEICLKPECSAEGLCEDIHLTFDSKLGVPKSKSATIVMRPSGAGDLVHNPIDESQPRQHTLDENENVDTETGEVTQ